MIDVTHIGSLEAQLQATLDKIPAHTWYGNPTGGLTFVNRLGAETTRQFKTRVWGTSR